MRLTLTIDGLAPGGEGVGSADGRAVFVPYTAPGDRVEVEAPAGPGPAHARLVRVLEPGAARVDPPCAHFGPGDAASGRGCGGCDWLHAAYPAQLAAKERGFLERLRRLAGLEAGDCQVRPIIPSPRPLRYRCRAKFHFDRRAGRLVFFRRRSHEAVPLAGCHLLEPELDALRSAVGPALLEARLEPREVALEWSARQGRGSAWLLLPAVTPATRDRTEELLSRLPRLAGAVLQGPDAMAPALAGDPVLEHDRDPADPSAGAQRSRLDVFRQANRLGNARLVQLAVDLLRPEGEEVLELFCGSGNFTGPLARRARGVAAVEVQGPALELARRDLQDARIRFFAGEAVPMALALARETGPWARRFGAALLDPPRDGAKGIGPALRELGVGRAVYVSCDPATLARDLKACRQAGFRVAAVQAVDMFPQTHHVEGVALLER